MVLLSRRRHYRRALDRGPHRADEKIPAWLADALQAERHAASVDDRLGDGRRTGFQHMLRACDHLDRTFGRQHLSERLIQQVFRADALPRTKGLVDRDERQSGVADEDRDREIVEDFLCQLDTLHVRAPLLFPLLLLGHVADNTDAIARWKTPLGKFDQTIGRVALHDVRAFAPMRRDPLRDPFIARPWGIGLCGLMGLVPIINGAEKVPQTGAGHDAIGGNLEIAADVAAGIGDLVVLVIDNEGDR